MATGFPTRPGARNSFAQEVAAPVQTTTGASAESRGVQTVGGENIGGQRGGNYQATGNAAAGLGRYFEQLLAPEIERKQRQNFFKGFTEAQSGRALDELTDGDSPLTKVFGPSGFAQGAQFYAGREAISRWQQDQIADMGTLRQMSSEELSKHLSASVQEYMTGDEFADAHIQEGFLEAQGPLVQLHTKARYEWQQETALNAVRNASNASATSLQQIVGAQIALGDKGDAEAIGIAVDNFTGSMAMPEGMDPDAYKKFLYDFMRNNMAEGNFHAVSIMQQMGVEQLFDDDQQRGIEDAYERYGNRALSHAVQDPKILDRLLRLDARIEQTKMGSPEGITTREIVKEYQEINGLLARATGVARPYFDTDDILQKGGEVNSAFTSAFLRQLRRSEELQDRRYSRETAQIVAAAEAAAQVAAAEAAFSTGQINAFQVAGGKTSDIDAVAMSDFAQGNYNRIANAYVQSSYVSTPVRNQIGAIARSGIGSEYTEATGKAYELWSAFNQVNPELADAYFGDHSQNFEVFDQIVNVSGPDAAFREAFGDGSRNRGSLQGTQREEFDEAFEEVFAENSFSALRPWRWQNYTLNEQGQRELRRTLYGAVASRASTSSRSVEELTRQAYNSAIADGRFEQYGVFGWSNGRRMQPISGMLGLQANDAHRVVGGTISQALERLGVDDTDRVSVIRVASGLALTYEGGDGFPQTGFVSNDELQEAADKYVRGNRDRRLRGVDPALDRGDAAPAFVPSL